MATVLSIYTKKPHFPATDEHPDAVLYQHGSYWVHAVGGAPTPAEVRGQPIDPRVAPGPSADLENVKEFLRQRIRTS